MRFFKKVYLSGRLHSCRVHRKRKLEFPVLNSFGRLIWENDGKACRSSGGRPVKYQWLSYVPTEMKKKCISYQRSNKQKMPKKIYENYNCFLWRHSAWKCVFKMEFRVLSREFESIETSPGFARLLGGNWTFLSLFKWNCDGFHDGSKKIVRWQKSRSEHCDFTKNKSWVRMHFWLKLNLRYFDEKTENEPKICKLTVWTRV